MGTNIKISGGTFNSSTIGGTVYQNVSMPELDFNKVQAELARIKLSLPDNSVDYHLVSALESTTKNHNKESFLQGLKSFAVQFSSATLANLAGGYLGRFL